MIEYVEMVGGGSNRKLDKLGHAIQRGEIKTDGRLPLPYVAPKGRYPYGTKKVTIYVHPDSVAAARAMGCTVRRG